MMEDVLFGYLPSVDMASELIIGTNVRSKAELLAEFKRFGFPAYMGNNWDALEECLNDLSWIREENFVVTHKGVPLEDSVKDLKIYLDILRSSAQRWKSEKGRRIYVVFPEHSKEGILKLLDAS
jgi:hypothetical protein